MTVSTTSPSTVRRTGTSVAAALPRVRDTAVVAHHAVHWSALTPVRRGCEVRQRDELAAAVPSAAWRGRRSAAVARVPAEVDPHAVAGVLGQVPEALPVAERPDARLRLVPAPQAGTPSRARAVVARLLEQGEAHRHAARARAPAACGRRRPPRAARASTAATLARWRGGCRRRQRRGDAAVTAGARAHAGDERSRTHAAVRTACETPEVARRFTSPGANVRRGGGSARRARRCRRASGGPCRTGWQFEQISTCSSGFVERVQNSLPQVQRTCAGTYSG